MNPETLSIPKIFSEIVSQFPQKIALQVKREDHWQRIAYKDLETSAIKVANFLLKEGLQKGDFVGLILENRPEWPVIYLGIMYASLACVPLDPQLNPEEIKNLIIDSDTKIIFCSGDIFSKKINQDIQGRLKKIVVLDGPESKGRDGINFFEIESSILDRSILPISTADDIASLIYTSGTTAKPKGVLLTHKNICADFLSIAKLKLCFPSDNFLSLLPLHHTYSFMGTLIVPLFTGATITYCPAGFKLVDLVEIIKEAEITFLVGIPQLFALIHASIFQKLKRIPPFIRFLFLPFIKPKIKLNFGKSLRLLVSGGARLNPKTGYDLWRLGFKIVEGYGLTETSPVVTFNPPQKIKFGSAGKPIPDVQISIHNPDKSGIGQVIIRGPNVMKGYFQQPDLTASVIKDGWFYSGDLGYIDKDGYLFITGREKEVIVLSSGKNIYPEELEEHYRMSPYIKEICILERREQRFGHEVESLYAVVVPNLEYFRQRKETNIRGKVRWELENKAKDLPPYKHIMGFTVTKEELPRTALQKIRRYQVREKYLKKEISKTDIQEAAFSPEDADFLNQDIAQKVMHYLSTQINKPIFLDSHLEIDLGIDSLTRVELGLGLEGLFSIKIPDQDLYTVSTVKEVILKILGLVNATQKGESYAAEEQKTWNQLLREQPKVEVLRKIRLRPYALDIPLTFIFKNLFLFALRIFWRLRIKGKDNLPKKTTPFVLCPNHASYLDGFIVFCSLPLKLAINTYFLGRSDIFEHPLIRWVIKLARLIPIDPNTDFIQGMQAVSYVLSHQKIVCIFPEGQRSIDEQVKEFKKGIGILIKELEVLAVPVYIKGSHHAWPRARILPRFSPVEIIFGLPHSAKEFIKARPEGDEYESIAYGLREEVIKLSVPNNL